MPFEPEDDSNEASLRLDTRMGVRPMADVETLTYSPLWDGDADATVTVSVEELYQAERTLVNGTGDEGTAALAAEGTQIYTVRHTTYTNGVAGAVLTAKFATFDAATEIVAQGYTNVYDGVSHTVSVTVPGMDAAANPTLVRYALAEEGPYLAPGERFTFKDVINTSVWYCVGSPDCGSTRAQGFASRRALRRSCTVRCGAEMRVRPWT